MLTEELPETTDYSFNDAPALAVPIACETVPRQSFFEAICQTRKTLGLPAAGLEFGYRVMRKLTRLEIARVLRLEMADLRPPRPPAIELEYRFLTAEELGILAADPRNDLDPAMAERVNSDHDFCFAAFEGDRLANYSWYASERIEPEHAFGAAMTFPPDTVYLYKAFTVPAYRGQRIHGTAVTKAAQFFRLCGIRRMMAIIETANWASFRSHAALGFRPMGRLLRLGRRAFSWGCMWK